ncbi:MAG: PilZ domain-containing protein [Leptospirales bacterium]|nr:PilZ domain-containing protein [Leptospirales bacterium]
MALALQKNLPVSVCPVENNEEGLKYQGQLKEIAKDSIVLFMGESAPLSVGAEIVVEFKVEKNQFFFETTIKKINGAMLDLHKPKAIHKSKIREGHRMSTDMKMNYTPWTESGRFETKLTDLSELGVRMQGRKELKKGMLISIDFYIKEDKIRVLCQGQVAWCRVNEENDQLFDTGVEFTTISNETRKRLTRFIQKQTGVTVDPQ